MKNIIHSLRGDDGIKKWKPSVQTVVTLAICLTIANYQNPQSLKIRYKPSSRGREKVGLLSLGRNLFLED